MKFIALDRLIQCLRIAYLLLLLVSITVICALLFVIALTKYDGHQFLDESQYEKWIHVEIELGIVFRETLIVILSLASAFVKMISSITDVFTWIYSLIF